MGKKYISQFHENFLGQTSLPSGHGSVEKMLELAEINPGKDVVYDLGCGDGRIPIRAVQEPFNARCAVGVESYKYFVDIALQNVKDLALQGKVKIIRGDIFNQDLSQADVVTMYFDRSSNERIRPKLEKELKKTARVVSNTFRIEAWKSSKTAAMNEPLGDRKDEPELTTIYLYRMDKI